MVSLFKKSFLIPLLVGISLIPTISHGYESSTFQTSLDWMYQNGLTRFSTVAEYKPDNLMTRQEAAKFYSEFAATVFGKTPDTTKNCNFKDINQVDPTLKDFVIKSCQLGIFQGSDGYFLPTQNLTQAQAMVVGMRIPFGMLDENDGVWWGKYDEKSRAFGINNDFQINRLYKKGIDALPASRGRVAEFLFSGKDLVGSPKFLEQGNFWTNGTKIFKVFEYGGGITFHKEIEGADIATFQMIEKIYDNAYYFKDKNKVYISYQNDEIRVIPGADPITFISLEHWYAKDKSHVYFLAPTQDQGRINPIILSGADSATFQAISPAEIMGNNQDNFGNAIYTITAKDKYNEYIWADGFPIGLDRITFEYVVPQLYNLYNRESIDHKYAKDKNHVYYFPDTKSRIFNILDGADVKTFTGITVKDAYFYPEIGTSKEYAKDKNNVYYKNGKIIEGADPLTFSVTKTVGVAPNLWEQIEYGKDKYRLYYKGISMIFGSADYSTLTILPYPYAKDKNSLYCIDPAKLSFEKKLPDANIATVQDLIQYRGKYIYESYIQNGVTHYKVLKDKNHTYNELCEIVQ